MEHAAVLSSRKLALRNIATLRMIIHRAGTLRITPEEIKACANLAAIQGLVKERYRVLAKYYHPDHLPYIRGRGRKYINKGGFSFQRMTRAYKWFMQLEGIGRPTYKWRLGDTVPDDPLPWSMECRSLSLPCGYQESRDHFFYR